MRICLDVRYDTRSGASTVMNSLVREMLRANQKHEFTLLELEGTPLDVDEPCERVQCPRLPAMRQYWWIQRTLPGLLGDWSIDLYQTFKHLGPFRAPCKLMYYMFTLGGFSSFFSNTYPMSLSEWVYWGFCARRWLPRLDRVITCTNYIREYIVKHYRYPADRITTVPLAADVEFVSAGGSAPVASPHPRPFILQVGNVLPVKNTQTTVKAFGLLAARHPDVDLVICGGQTHRYFQATAALVQRLGLEQRVIFKGFVPKEELLAHYRAARVLIHPSMHEGFSQALIEGMASGAPVITSDRPALPEVGGDAVLRYQPVQDPAAMAELVERVLNDEALRADLSRRAICRAGEFSWERTARETLAVYDLLD